MIEIVAHTKTIIHFDTNPIKKIFIDKNYSSRRKKMKSIWKSYQLRKEFPALNFRVQTSICLIQLTLKHTIFLSERVQDWFDLFQFII